MKLTLLVAACALSVVAIGCEGGDSKATLTSRTADELTQDVLDAMAGVPSYHLEFLIEGQDATWAFDYVAPDSYRVLVAVERIAGTTPGQECYVLPGDETAGSCEDAAAQSAEALVYESIYLGDKLYARECEDVDQGCGEWETQDRPPTLIVGPSPSFLPGWPLVAVEMAQIVSLETDANDLLLVGSVNHQRAVLEGQRRVLTAAGITSFGTVCLGGNETPVMIGENATGSPPVGLQCHEMTFEESLENQEPELSYLDDHPAAIRVRVLPETDLIRSITVTFTGQPVDSDPAPQPTTLVIEYSYGDIEIEAPD